MKETLLPESPEQLGEDLRRKTVEGVVNEADTIEARFDLQTQEGAQEVIEIVREVQTEEPPDLDFLDGVKFW